MIPFDFEYYKPETIEEAVQLYAQLNARGKSPYITVVELRL